MAMLTQLVWAPDPSYKITRIQKSRARGLFRMRVILGLAPSLLSSYIASLVPRLGQFPLLGPHAQLTRTRD